MIKIKIKGFKRIYDNYQCYNIEFYETRKDSKGRIYQNKYQSISLLKEELKLLIKELKNHGTRSTKRKKAR